ncbi:MAG: hypothetical protein JXR10_06240 [Cyclobacteriaceae bacterium]
MIKALRLEWLKVKNYKTFWILLGMYFLALTIVCFGGMFLLEYLKSQGADFEGIDPTILPIYDFPDIWQNMTYLGSFLKVLLAFIVIISITNDLTYNTLRQNIIDGTSKKEYLIGKMSMIISMALASMIFVFFAGLINGAMYSHVWGAEYILEGSSFLLAYAYDIIIFCCFAFLLSLLIKKSGFVIVIVFLYSLMFEPIFAVILENQPDIKATFIPHLVPFLPIKALNNLIAVPFPRYIFREIVDYIPFKALAIATAWLGIYITGIMYILIKRDLK